MRRSRTEGGSRLAASLAVTAGAVAFAVWATWPMAAHLHDQVFEPPKEHRWWIRPDVMLQHWVMAWDAHALATNPLGLFDANILYPAPRSLATHDHMLGTMPVYLPARILSGSPVFAGQFTLLATFVLAYLAAFALVWDWTRSWPAAMVAACMFAFSPFRSLNLGALNLESNYYLPLIPLCARRASTGRGIAWPLALAIVLAMQGLISFQVMYATIIGAATLCAVALALDRDARARWPYVAVPIAAAGAVVAVTAIPYTLNAMGGALRTELPELREAFAARLGDTQSHVLALLPLMLAGVLWRHGLSIGNGGPWVLGLAAAAGAAHLFAVGPVLFELAGVRIPGPWAAALWMVPGFQSVRMPARFNTVATMGIAAIAGIGAAGLIAWMDRRLPPGAAAARRSIPRFAAVALAALAAHQFLPGRMPLRKIETAETIPPAYRWLATAPRGAVLDLPMQDWEIFAFDREAEALRVYRSIYHWQPIANGYTGYPPPTYRLVAALAARLPRPDAIDLIARLAGIRYVVVNDDPFAEIFGDPWAASGLKARRFPGHTIYEIPPATAGAPALRQLPGYWRERSPTGLSLSPLPAKAQRGGVNGPILPLTAFGFPAAGMVRIENRSDTVWPGVALPRSGGVALAYEVFDGRGRRMQSEPIVTPLGVDVPGRSLAEVPLWFWPRAEPGDYQIEVRLVQDGIGTFDAGAAPPRRIPLRILPLPNE